jgi:hypothetical protein
VARSIINLPEAEVGMRTTGHSLRYEPGTGKISEDLPRTIRRIETLKHRDNEAAYNLAERAACELYKLKLRLRIGGLDFAFMLASFLPLKQFGMQLDVLLVLVDEMEGGLNTVIWRHGVYCRLLDAVYRSRHLSRSPDELIPDNIRAMLEKLKRVDGWELKRCLHRRILVQERKGT